MQAPTLVILAAGMGSRFGGPKQIMAVDDHGHAIIDFSLFDAYKAGFRKVAFIIKKEMEADFKAVIGTRMEKYFEVKYVHQEITNLPEGYSVPEGRVKPWGTGHAVLCAKDAVDGPFAVINADDFYGPSAYRKLYDFLSQDRNENEHMMVSYLLRNTVTENGSVARGICEVETGFLTDVVERTRIEKRGEDAAFTEDGESFTPLSGLAQVSMNCWGFGKGMFNELSERFGPWLDANVPVNPEKAEYYLPYSVNLLIKEGTGSVRVMESEDKWYGMTYKEDMPGVVAAIAQMREEGKYPVKLLD